MTPQLTSIPENSGQGRNLSWAEQYARERMVTISGLVEATIEAALFGRHLDHDQKIVDAGKAFVSFANQANQALSTVPSNDQLRSMTGITPVQEQAMDRLAATQTPSVEQIRQITGISQQQEDAIEKRAELDLGAEYPAQQPVDPHLAMLNDARSQSAATFQIPSQDVRSELHDF